MRNKKFLHHALLSFAAGSFFCGLALYMGWL